MYTTCQKKFSQCNNLEPRFYCSSSWIYDLTDFFTFFLCWSCKKSQLFLLPNFLLGALWTQHLPATIDICNQVSSSCTNWSLQVHGFLYVWKGSSPSKFQNEKTEIQEACFLFFWVGKFTAAIILSKASRPLLSIKSATDARAWGLIDDKNLRWLSVSCCFLSTTLAADL